MPGHLKKGRFRKYVFTSYELQKTLTTLECANAIFYQYGLEVCPKTGRDHHQGYMHFKHPRDSYKLAKAMGGIHIEVQEGNNKQNDDYTGKDGKVVRFGEPLPERQGHRSDLEDILEMVKARTPPLEILEAYPGSYVRYHKHFGLPNPGVLLTMQNEFRKVNVTVLTGDPGTGKTRRVYEEHQNYEIIKITQYNPEWWQAHNPCPKVLLLDEYEAGALSEDRLRQLCDGHPIDLPIKGGFISGSQVEHVYIISNSELEWSPAMARRITQTIKLRGLRVD